VPGQKQQIRNAEAPTDSLFFLDISYYPITGAVLGRQNTSSVKLSSKYGRR